MIGEFAGTRPPDPVTWNVAASAPLTSRATVMVQELMATGAGGGDPAPAGARSPRPAKKLAAAPERPAELVGNIVAADSVTPILAAGHRRSRHVADLAPAGQLADRGLPRQLADYPLPGHQPPYTNTSAN